MRTVEGSADNTADHRRNKGARHARELLVLVMRGTCTTRAAITRSQSRFFLANKHVATHVNSEEDLLMRLRAGIDSVEHIGVGRSGATGTTYEPEILDLLAQCRVAVIPTLNVDLVYEETEAFPERLEDPEALKFFPQEFQERVRASGIRNYSHLRYFDTKRKGNPYIPGLFKQLVDAGVNVLMGTEAGTPLNFHSTAAPREMVWMHKPTTCWTILEHSTKGSWRIWSSWRLIRWRMSATSARSRSS